MTDPNRLPRLFAGEEYPVGAEDGDLWWPMDKPLRVKEGDRWKLVNLSAESAPAVSNATREPDESGS